MKFLNALLILGIAVAGLDSAEAQIRKAGITGAAFLKIGVGARGVALGSAYTTIQAEANQMFWNPAGTNLEQGRTQVALSYNQWIADLNHYALAASRDFGNAGTFGVGIVGLGLSGIDNSNGADRDQIPAFLDATYTGFRDTNSGEYDYQDLALQLTWSRRFTDKLIMGATGKVISQTIDDESASAFAVDFGAIYNIGVKGARIGARINNLGTDIEYYHVGAPLPLIFSVGAAIDVMEETATGTKFTLLADATKPQDGEQLIFTAGEAQIWNKLVLRGGYKFNYSGIDDDKVDEVTGTTFSSSRTEEGFSLGLGVDVPWQDYNATVDYAFTEFGILDNVHRISLQLDF